MIDVALSPGVAFTILFIFGVLWIFAGYYLGRKNKTLDDHMLAGRNVGLAFASATAMATWVTSNTTMTAPQLTYQLGVWGMIGYSLGAIGLLLFAPLAGRIKALLPHGFTSGDFIRERYGVMAWRIFLIISMCYAMGWLISLGMAGGILVNALSGLNYHLGMSVIMFVCVSYTLLGGLRAVIATDFVQTIIILLGVITIAFLVIDNIGFETLHENLQQEHPMLLSLVFPAAIMFLFNNLFFGVGEIFHSNVWWSRAFAFRVNTGTKAYLIGGLLWLPIPVVAGFIALAAPSMGLIVPSADMVGPMVAGQILGTTGAVIVFIVIFSALASSLDSLLAATSDLITQDLYRGHINKGASDDHCYKVSKYIILGLGLLTWLLCLPRITTLASLLYFTGAFVASAIWPIVFGLYYRWTSGIAASLAMLAGTVIGLVAYFQIGFYVAALVSSAVSLVVIVVVSYFSKTNFSFERLSEDKGVSS
ncbi:MAG: urea transporter [Gammaproteobacteria bacterium]|nr:urea transporter [Gammaproteobacteria bacterium]|tara:strand:- start:1732 stop:3162 length:1431 start_codon:yes stop_codon:yes gene_type:complete